MAAPWLAVSQSQVFCGAWKANRISTFLKAADEDGETKTSCIERMTGEWTPRSRKIDVTVQIVVFCGSLVLAGFLFWLAPQAAPLPRTPSCRKHIFEVLKSSPGDS